MQFTQREILETIRMTEMEHLDIRTVTMGINLRDCADSDINRVCEKVYNKIIRYAGQLVETVNRIGVEFGITIANKRISITPVASVGEACDNKDYPRLARTIDKAAVEVGVDFIGGYSALVHKGFTRAEEIFMASIPEALSTTERLCSSVNAATTRAGINMTAIRQLGQIIKVTAQRTADRGGIGCAKFVVFANAVEDNPFMAGAFFGVGEPEVVVNVGVSGPGVVNHAVRMAGDCDLGELSEIIKRTAFKVTRAGELVGREAARRLGVEFGIIDLSLAPTPLPGDSVGEILEAMGLERAGAPGSTAALAMLTDAVKKGGAMASSYVGGMSGAFIPVSEDAAMIEAAQVGALTLEKLEAMTSVCSVGLDMVAVPGDTSAETISAIIADEIAIGVVNNKTTGVRIIPVPGKKVGEIVDFGGLLGSAPIMPVNQFNCARFINRGGRIPAPVQSLRN
ncbi:MAG TPA: PFL family protein [Blastocatellia bacterium]|nr:PFL family protein [Blastocatellia bacterium]